MLQRTDQGDGEAVLDYGDFSFEIVKPGRFVRCAVTGEQILLDDLRYWNADRQEAYKGPDEALKRWREINTQS